MRLAVPHPVFAAGFALNMGCHDATDPEQQRLIGRIDASNTQVPVIMAPEEVQAAVPFTVIVHTTGTSGCTRPDGEALEVQGNLIRIIPYDIVPAPGHSDVCRSDYVFHEHRLSVTLPAAGSARVRVVGFKASRAEAVLDSVESSLTVRP